MAKPYPQLEFVPGDALIVVDMQNDFFEGGTLAVRGAEAILPRVNRYLRMFAAANLPVFAARCWHPSGHCSFKSQGGPWPEHCVAGTRGAEFHPELKLPFGCPVVSKGILVDRDAYSAFAGTELDPWLRERRIRRVFVAGLTTDYCVKSTVIDLMKHNLPAFVLIDGIAAVNVQPGDGERAMADMLHQGAVFIDIESVAQ